MDSILKDIRYGIRNLLKHSGFTAIAVLTIALGVGATTAMFSVLNGVLLKALPFPEPQQLISMTEGSREVPEMNVAYPTYLDWRAQQTTLTDLSARQPAGGVLTGGGDPERITGRWVSASFFPTLGVTPLVGRFFSEQDDRPGADRVIVLSHRLWQRRFGNNTEIVGKAINYNGEPWTVVGILPSNFDYYGVDNANNDFFIPLGQLSDQQYMRDRVAHTVLVTARMKPGVTLEQVQSEFSAIGARLAALYPDSNSGTSVTIKSFLDDYVGDIRQALLTVSTAVAILLLIACANVANLLMTRATDRKREIAIRCAMGASRRRIVRQLLTESLLLAISGGLLGLLLAVWGVSAIVKLSPDALYRTHEISINFRVLLFSLAVTFVTGIIFGLAPALQTSKLDIQQTLKQASLSAASGMRALRVTSIFVVVELAFSLVLMVGAGLLVRSLQQLLMVHPGFDADNVLTLRLRLPDVKYQTSAQTTNFLEAVLAQTRDLPGVVSAAVTTGFPLRNRGDADYQVEGEPEPKRAHESPVAIAPSVSEQYHDVLGIGLRAGRLFTKNDTAESPMVVVVDDMFVRRHFANLPVNKVLGKRLRFGGDGEPWREIVGVVTHVRQNGLEEEGRAAIYRPWQQMDPNWLANMSRAMDLVIKTSTDPETLIAPVRGVVRSVDTDQPIANVHTLREIVDESLATRRFTVWLLTMFAGLAFLLGGVGLYGVMAYQVTQRTREIGIRMALGAQQANVVRLVLLQGMSLVIIAVGIGIGGSWMLTRLMSSLLFGVSATDSIAFLVPPVLLVAIALLACLIPARRATKVDPLIALRSE